ncbi:pre-toxin TG domain-containing protein [Bacillus sp. FSL K6-0046]|uniref:pre-toxin TG domain-containing protein n=1 Tax=unclassified Bacillus (in: firmicutes) TaxID=185979 RepID=UPI00315A241E
MSENQKRSRRSSQDRKQQEVLANCPWYEKALDYGGNDAKRAITGVDPITDEELTAGRMDGPYFQRQKSRL